MSREQKLHVLEGADLTSVDWQTVIPNAQGDWINQRDETFSTWPILGQKDRAASADVAILRKYTLGLATNRDAWAYNFSQTELAANITRMIEGYQEERVRFLDLMRTTDARISDARVNNYLTDNPNAANSARIKWSAGLKARLARGEDIGFVSQEVRRCAYRPFNIQYAYFDDKLCERRGNLPKLFPTRHHHNIGLQLNVGGTPSPFCGLMISHIPDLNFFGQGGQFFPRWTYVHSDDEGTLDFTDDEGVDEWGYRRLDNVTDKILTLYREAVSDTVTKDDIFYYLYGTLHDPDYRTRYAADLKKMLPHIPTPDTVDRFTAVADVGRRLADLHLNYEEVAPYPLNVELSPGADPMDRGTWRVDTMRWRSKIDRDAIVYNGKVMVTGIPAKAHDYTLGPRTALEWIIDRYQVKTDKASGIVNDPNEWCDEHDEPTYIVDLIKKITTISVETVALVEQLSQ